MDCGKLMVGGARRLGAAVMLCMLATAASAETVIFSTTEAVSFDGTTYQKGDLAQWDGERLQPYLSIFGGSRNLDAVYVFAGGDVLLSISGSGSQTLGGVTFRSGDLVRYDPVAGTASLYLMGSSSTSGTDAFGHRQSIFRTSNGSETSGDIDAVHVLWNGNILLSTAGSARLWSDHGLLRFSDEDLVEYNPVTGLATMFFDFDEFFSTDEDIDAVSVLLNGHLLLSATSAVTIGGVTFAEGDLFEFDTLTRQASLYFSRDDLAKCSFDIDAVHVLAPSIPEPATMGLLGLGLGFMLVRRRPKSA
ncbi:MAG: PEP-CTERM sorting domain-containing protein [Planctomycetes bacterium]|nr:PEP-CTERM sorting domain-containing protein [Planctomycetota bacterium]